MIPPAVLAFLLVAQAPPEPTFLPATLDLPRPVYLWRDFDRDGRSDVYVRSPRGEDRLLRNRGDAFEDVTARFGLAELASTLDVAWTDFENDGLPDLYVVAADGASRLFHNAGTSFVDVTESAGIAHEGPAQFHEWIDGDADGLSDLHVVTPVADVLFQNLGASRFAAIPLPTRGRGTDIVPIGGQKLAPEEVGASPSSREVASGRSRPGAAGRSSSASGYSEGSLEVGVCGASTLDDAGAPGCLQASSVPTLGMLYPLSADLNVAGTGLVGIGTTTPSQKLDVDGMIRSRTGGIQFPDGSVQGTAEAVDSGFATGVGVDPSATLQFLAPPATVTIAAGQRIYVSANKALGSRYTAGACCLSLWVGYRLTPAGSITTVGGGMLGNKVNRNTRTVHGVNGVLSGLPAGTYEVGMVGGTADPHWDFNGSGYTSALVFN